jgi:hypothetical protein
MDMMDTHLASTDIARIGRPRGFLSEPALVHCDLKLRKFSDRTPTILRLWLQTCALLSIYPAPSPAPRAHARNERHNRQSAEGGLAPVGY